MTPSGSSPVSIRLVTQSGERDAVLAFIATEYERVFHTQPKAPQILFAAFRGNTVVGSISLDTATDDTILPAEHIYSFDHTKTPFSFERSRLVQYGRWIAVEPGLSRVLMCAATMFALKIGMRQGLTEVKPSVAARAKDIGIRLHKIEDAILLAHRVPETDQTYYQTDPLPQLFMMDLQEKHDALREYTDTATQQDKVAIEGMDTWHDYSLRDSVKSMRAIRSTVSDVATTYDTAVEAYDDTTAVFHKRVVYPKIVHMVQAHSAPIAGKRLVDIGCGSGRLSAVFQKQDALCIGIDVSHASLVRAHRRNLQTICASAHKLPLKSSSQDIVVSSYVINYLPLEGQRLLIEEAFRILTPGGTLVLSLMHPSLLRVRSKSYFEPNRQFTVEQVGQKFSLHITDWPDLVNMLTESGFAIHTLVDAEIPSQLDSLTQEIGDQAARQFVRGFAKAPYACFVACTRSA